MRNTGFVLNKIKFAKPRSKYETKKKFSFERTVIQIFFSPVASVLVVDGQDIND